MRALNDTGTLLATNTITATVNNHTPPPPPPSSTGAVTQTIANGSTISSLDNWRAVYDANGDGVEDDPGSIQFLIDGNQVLTEINAPVRRHLRQRHHHHQQRPAHLPGARPQRQRHPARHQHHHRHRQQPDTPPPTGDTIAPSQPGNLKVASASPTGVAIAWNAATDNVAVTGYDIYRGSSRDRYDTADHRELQRPDVRYRRIRSGVDAFDAAGNSSPPANMTVTTSPCADTQPPTAPTNVTASTRTTTSIALTWAPATDNVGVAGYGVYNGADLVDTTAGTTGIVSGLTCGTNYTLAVDAFDATGNSSPKTAVMVSTLPCADTTPPTQPTNLRTTSATTTSLTTRLERLHRQRRRRRLRHLPRHHQSRHRHHNHLHDQRTHLRNHLHASASEPSTPPATPPPRPPSQPPPRPCAPSLTSDGLPRRLEHRRSGRYHADRVHGPVRRSRRRTR